ncbi:MAG: hypothetical protein ACI9UO_001724 [Nitrospinales bacterium]|jgi:hypothetical protein
MARRLVFFLILLLLLSESSFASEKGIPECLAHIKPLHIQRERVAELDGIWGLFEKNRVLQGNSAIAIDLDKNINSIIFHLQYLCDTLHGIPMNEIARYVQDGIAVKGEKGFSEELIILGKTESEIDLWFEFTRFSIKNKERPLKLKSILNSIKGSTSFLDTYVSIAQKLDRREIKDSHEKDSFKNLVIKLSKNIEGFFKSDPYMHQAFRENANIPYYDINESSGGS